MPILNHRRIRVKDVPRETPRKSQPTSGVVPRGTVLALSARGGAFRGLLRVGASDPTPRRPAPRSSPPSRPGEWAPATRIRAGPSLDGPALLRCFLAGRLRHHQSPRDPEESDCTLGGHRRGRERARHDQIEGATQPGLTGKSLRPTAARPPRDPWSPSRSTARSRNAQRRCWASSNVPRASGPLLGEHQPGDPSARSRDRGTSRRTTRSPPPAPGHGRTGAPRGPVRGTRAPGTPRAPTAARYGP